MASNEKNIPNTVQNEGTTRFRVKFIPNQTSIHHVTVKFNGSNIPGKLERVGLPSSSPVRLLLGSPFQCHVYPSEFSFENYEYAPINKRTSFIIRPKLASQFRAKMYFDILSPSGERLDGEIEQKSSSISALHCVPTEIGDHQIQFYRDQAKQIPLMKFLCQVYDASQIRIGDLRPAVPHQPYKFTGLFGETIFSRHPSLHF